MGGRHLASPPMIAGCISLLRRRASYAGEPRTRGPAEEPMTAATACRTCGTEPREGARFCDGCGSLVAPATEHAEYKQATVLFADVVHSTDIAAAVGAERLGEIMSAPP